MCESNSQEHIDIRVIKPNCIYPRWTSTYILRNDVSFPSDFLSSRYIRPNYDIHSLGCLCQS